jgi:hypothetical protein
MAGWPGISRRYKRNAAQRFSFSDPGLPATLETGTKYPGYYCLKWADDILLEKEEEGEEESLQDRFKSPKNLAGTG